MDLVPPFVDEGSNGQESESVVTLEDELPARPASAGLPTTLWGEAPLSSSKPGRVDGGDEDEHSGIDLMERVVSRANLTGDDCWKSMSPWTH